MEIYLQQVLTLIAMYVMLAVSYNLLFGYAGMTSLAHAAFWGIGAYGSALAAVTFGAPWPVALLVGVLAASAIAFVVALPSIRLKGDYLLITSLGMQVIITSVLNNWTDVTRGPLGIRAIPRPSAFGVVVASPVDYVVLALSLATAVCLVAWRLGHSPFGRALKAVRDDEVALAALGRNVVALKLTVFVISGALAAVAGSFYAHYVTYIDPESFVLANSFLVLTLVAIGGAGNLLGAVLGTIVMIAVPEALRFTDLPSAVVAPTRQILFGATLVLFMLFRPQGLLPEYRPKVAARLE